MYPDKNICIAVMHPSKFAMNLWRKPFHKWLIYVLLLFTSVLDCYERTQTLSWKFSSLKYIRQNLSEFSILKKKLLENN